MKKLLVLGGTGRTGKCVIQEALNRGYEVNAIVRDAAKLAGTRALVFVGTPYDYATVEKAAERCDAVISALNISRKSDSPWAQVISPKDLMSKSIENTVRAMKKKGIRRIVVVSALGAGDSAKEMPGLFNFFIRITNIKYAYRDHDAQENTLERSELDWTIVRPVMLTDKNDELEVSLSINGKPKLTSPSVSRNAVAHFMLNCIEDGGYIRQKPGISGKKHY